jgi:ubiquinone/menaquinone biosynthesis C-methylase UbiE
MDDRMKTAKYFDKFSKEYESQDRYRYLFYRWIVKSIIRQVDREDSDIVDVGTGTGNLAVRLAARYPKSRILGVDVSKGMLKEAEAKRKRMRITNVRFRLGSAENIGAERADFVVSALAFHHVKNKTRAVSNIYSKLIGGGKLVIGDWFEPDGKYAQEVAQLRRRKPKLAREFDRSWEEALNGMQGRYSEEHPKEYPISQTELVRIMEDVGFRKRKILRSLIPNFAVVVGGK